MELVELLRALFVAFLLLVLALDFFELPFEVLIFTCEPLGDLLLLLQLKVDLIEIALFHDFLLYLLPQF